MYGFHRRKCPLPFLQKSLWYNTHTHTHTHTHTATYTHTFVNTHIEASRHMHMDNVLYRHNANTKICPWGKNGDWRPKCVSVFVWERLRMLPPRSEKVQFTSTAVSTSLIWIWHLCAFLQINTFFDPRSLNNKICSHFLLVPIPPIPPSSADSCLRQSCLPGCSTPVCYSNLLIF